MDRSGAIGWSRPLENSTWKRRWDFEKNSQKSPKGYKQVQEVADENPDRGGDGVTLVKLV